MSEPTNDDSAARHDRIPAGQHLTRRWPVLHVGSPPAFDPATWSFEISGLVEQPLQLTWEAFNALPMIDQTSDMHCVTTWSRLDMTWRGVPMATLLEQTRPRAGAAFVIAHCDGGYTTNIALDVLREPDVLLAIGADGETLSDEHGFPMRLVIPSRYAWKSAKWLRRLEFVDEDRPGFWEVRGYHNNADPWTEERFG